LIKLLRAYKDLPVHKIPSIHHGQKWILIDIHNFQGPHDLIHKSRFITFHYMWYI
jgi:hypothetical protein